VEDKLRLSLAGPLSGRPEAPVYAEKIARLMHRYAAEVVAANQLCPFLHNVETGLGAVVVFLGRELDVVAAAKAIRDTESQVVHLVFPLANREDAPGFERFGNAVADRLRKDGGDPLVHATFHPAMVGGRENAHRLVGVLRRAPDAFLQFIPPGMQGGGTVMAGEDLPKAPAAESTFDRMTKTGRIEDVVALMDELHAERKRIADELEGAFSG
jgi:hypothetical protein